MKKYFLILTIAIFISACGSVSEEKTDGTADNSNSAKTEVADSTETKTTAGQFNVGDKVVANWRAVLYYEGVVESVSDDKITVKFKNSSNPRDVDKNNVYPLPEPGANPDVKVGDLVLSHTNSWEGAEITKIEGDSYTVKPKGKGEMATVSSDQIIKISAELAKKIEEVSAK